MLGLGNSARCTLLGLPGWTAMAFMVGTVRGEAKGKDRRQSASRMGPINLTRLLAIGEAEWFVDAKPLPSVRWPLVVGKCAGILLPRITCLFPSCRLSLRAVTCMC